MNNELNQVDLAFQKQDNQLGLELLRNYVFKYPQDVEQIYRLAVIEEQIGDPEKAMLAYLQCINSAKNYMIAYLYAGYFFQQQGQTERALAIYSLGNDIDGQLINLHKLDNVSYETKLRSYNADIALKKHFCALHQMSLSLDNQQSKIQNEKSRIQSAIWPQTHTENVTYLTEQQKPHMFYVPELLALPVHSYHSHPWYKNVEENFLLIKEELANIVDNVLSDGEPYLDKSFEQKGFKGLAGSKNWSALHLYNNGVANDELLKRMPLTSKLLDSLPLYKLNDKPFEVFFSLLKAGQHIKPHYGLSNHTLTVHLPLVVPKGGYLRVANEKVNWQEGQLIIFDDSFEHEAINLSQEDRVVLIFSVWHQELSELDQLDIQNSFMSRQKWLESRSQQLS
ncbi:MAG: aspartyl/asparaginyl beta-hydroxylase domain-containing protein [Colwellia sp.]|nr:aspartyl/asparaginyl beta-hydroxylase domain-containing protein [Colwellia sp.]